MIMVYKSINEIKPKIEEVYIPLIYQYNLKLNIERAHVLHLSNSVCSIIVHMERYTGMLSFFLKDLITDNQYPFYKIYELKGKPHIELGNIDDKILEIVIWHSEFIKRYLEAEMSGDFSALKNIIDSRI